MRVYILPRPSQTALSDYNQKHPQAHDSNTPRACAGPVYKLRNKHGKKSGFPKKRGVYVMSGGEDCTRKEREDCGFGAGLGKVFLVEVVRW